MAFGLQIKTTDGDQNVRDIRSARLLRKITLPTGNSSFSVPEFDSSTGFFLCVYFNNNLQVSFNNSTKLFVANNSPTVVDVSFFGYA